MVAHLWLAVKFNYQIEEEEGKEIERDQLAREFTYFGCGHLESYGITLAFVLNVEEAFLY